MDNYFSNIFLFKHLRDLQIGARGTVRPSSKEYPGRLKVEKSDQHPWKALSGVVVDQAVLAINPDKAVALSRKSPAGQSAEASDFHNSN
ncbi:hypothetical protein BGZ47_008492 [Haplosporangium gracile]|nr:hypothetical protein BGZ47_008492 [Haplosporangium gracile]